MIWDPQKIIQERDIQRKNQNDLILGVRSIIKEYEKSGEIYLGGIPMIANDVVSYHQY